MEISGWSGDINDIGVGQNTGGGLATTMDVDTIDPALSAAEDVLWLSSYSTTRESITITSPAGWAEVGNYSDVNGATALAHIESNGVQVPQGTWALDPAAPPFRQTVAILPGTGATLDPDATLDDAALEPGKAITGTYANYTSAPTVVTLTDSEGNTVSSASEITDLVIDDGAKTYAFTMPDRITTGTGTTLLRGDITVELT
jgi:hypothetical protein